MCRDRPAPCTLCATLVSPSQLHRHYKQCPAYFIDCKKCHTYAKLETPCPLFEPTVFFFMRYFHFPGVFLHTNAVQYCQRCTN